MNRKQVYLLVMVGLLLAPALTLGAGGSGGGGTLSNVAQATTQFTATPQPTATPQRGRGRWCGI